MATASDIILVGVLIFMFGVGFFVLHFIMGSMVETMTNITTINESSGAVAALEGINTVVNRLDYVIFGLFIALVLALIITSWFVAGNPLFMFIYFIVIVIGVVVATVLSNVWETVTNASIFGLTVAYFPITNNLLSKLPFYIAIIGFIGMVVMFAKPYIEGRGY